MARTSAKIGLATAGLTAAILTGFDPAGATAATCLDRLAAFASTYELSVAQVPIKEGDPSAPLTEDEASPPGTPEDLGRTGGVIVPPATPDPMVIEPPPMADTMPTAPPVEPDGDPEAAPRPSGENPPGEEPSGEAPALDPVRRAQAQALVDGALAFSRQGDERRCLDRLAEAQALVTPEPAR